MARRSIGELVAIVSADTEQFNKNISDVEKQLTGLGKLAASPLTFGLGAMSGIGGVFGSVESFARPLSNLFKELPGPDDWAHLLDPEKANRAFSELKDSLVELGRESAKLGLDPQVLRGIRELASGDAEAAEKAIGKLMVTIGQGTDETVQKLARWGLSWEELRASTPEELLGKIADAYKALDDPLDQAAMRFDLASKSGAGLHKVLAGGSEAIDKYIESIKKLGIATPRQIVGAEMIHQVEKEEKLQYHGYTAEAFERYGMARMMYAMQRESAEGLLDDKFWEGVAGGFMTYLDAALGTRSHLPPSRIAEFNRRVAEKNKAKPTAEEIANRMAAEAEAAEADRRLKAIDDANDSILKVNDSLAEQARILRLTEQGWAGFERQVMQVEDAVAAGGDFEQAMQTMDRLAEMAQQKKAKKEAEDYEKSVADIQRQIEAKIRGGARVSEFAPTALLGSQEYAQALNRSMGFTAPAQVDVSGSLAAIAEQLKKPALSPELQDRIRTVAIEVKKFNDNLKVQGPVN